MLINVDLKRLLLIWSSSKNLSHSSAWQNLLEETFIFKKKKKMVDVCKTRKKGLLLVLFGHFNSLWKQSLPLRVLVRDWYIAIHQKNHLYCPLQEHHAGPRKKSTTIWRCILVRCTMSKLRSIRFEGEIKKSRKRTTTFQWNEEKKLFTAFWM